MKPFALIAYIQYLWRAKKLHGVHSPFAYAFSEEILYTDHSAVQPLPIGVPAKYARLLSYIKDKRGYQQLNSLTAGSDTSISPCSMVVITENNPGKWLQLFNNHLKELKADCVIAIPGIHKSKRHDKKWKLLYTHPKILMSIDLYGIGLIFFRPEFKEKQHFVLKY
jgi:hypothetical protein